MEILSESKLDLAELSLFPSVLTPLPFTVWVIYSAEMAPTDKQFSALKEQVASLRDSVQAMQPGSSPVPWVTRRPTLAWLIGSLIAVLALVLTFYTVIGPHLENDFSLRVGKQISDSLSLPNQKISTIEGNIATINGRLEALGPLISGLVLERFRRGAGLSNEEFQKQLPETRHLISLARQERIEVDPALVQKIGQKLLSVRPRTQEFWSASAELVSYRSANLASQTTKKLASAQLPNCSDSSPAVSGSVVISSPTSPPKVNPGVYKDCRVALDSPENEGGIAAIQMQQPSLIFRNCLVVYKGGRVNPIIGWHIYERSVPADKSQPPSERIISISYTLVFEDCLLDFAIEGIPPADGQKVTRTVLAQTGNRITLPKS